MTTEKSFKVTVCFEQRADGGLRAWSDDVPGLILSSTDIDGVLEDVRTALEVILSHEFEAPIDVRPLVGIREVLETNGVLTPKGVVLPSREYVASLH